MSENVELYAKIKQEVENDIMARLHPILKEIQTGQNTFVKEFSDFKKQMAPILDAWDTTTSGGRLFRLVGKFVLWAAAVLTAGLFLWEKFKHSLTR